MKMHTLKVPQTKDLININSLFIMIVIFFFFFSITSATMFLFQIMLLGKNSIFFL